MKQQIQYCRTPSALLGKVTVPTLVLHSRGDASVPVADGEERAASIPGARFVPLEGVNHKAAVLLGVATGLVLSIIELWKMFARGGG